VIEPRKKTKSKEPTVSQHPDGHGADPNNSNLDQAILPGSEGSASQHMSSAREPGDLEGASPRLRRGKQLREGDKPRAADQAFEESSVVIVPKKSANTMVTRVESMEGRTTANGKLAERNTHRIQDRASVLTHLERVGQRAKERRKERFVNLLSHIKVPLLREAFARLRKDAAPGVDEIDWKQYADNLDVKLLDLQERVQRGSYHPLPVRRVHIPKADGRTRPIGVCALEDKIVQQAARMLLEPIYENSEFRGFSYGCRPGRHQHQALDALYMAINGRTSWVLDADIRSFFDTIDHDWMKRFIEHRIGDKRMVRLLMKWLKAGVMEAQQVHDVSEGIPQGGVVSPLLANVYLHYVVDLWVNQWRKTKARGDVHIVRYVDDLVITFQLEGDARAMRTALAERLAKFGLELHPDKTHVIRFGRFARKDAHLDGRTRPETFDFLGFTHISAATLKKGEFRLVRRTSRKKRNAKLAVLTREIREGRHDPVAEQQKWLNAVLRGHYNYYGVPGNFRALQSFRDSVRRSWHRALQTRSQRGRWSYERQRAFDQRFLLARPRITHESPLKRFK
jgi:RNA-directed DNA polymerase